MKNVQKVQALVIHLSHTDISRDERILRSIRGVAAALDCQVWGLGIRSESSWVGSSDTPPNVKVHSIRLLLPRFWSRRFLTLKTRGASRGFRRALIFLFANGVMFFVALAKTSAYKLTVVHIHDFQLLPAALLLATLKGANLIYDAHELESARTGISRSEANLTKRIEGWAWRRIAAFITVSPGILSWYHREFGPKQSAVVLNSPYLRPIGGNQVEIQTLRTRLGIPNSRPVFVHVGLLTKGRGIETMLDVFASPQGEEFDIVFVGDGPLREEIQSYCSKFDNVHLLKPVPNNEVVPLVSSADFGIVLTEAVSESYILSLPNKLFEVGRAGIPVIASNVPEIKRVVDTYGLGIVVEPTFSGLSEGLQKILARRGETIPFPYELSQEYQAEKIQKLYATIIAS